MITPRINDRISPKRCLVPQLSIRYIYVILEVVADRIRQTFAEEEEPNSA